MAYEVEAFGKIIEVPDDVPKQEAYKQIMANRHKLDPTYKPPGIGDKLNALAKEYLGVDSTDVARAFTPTPSIADQAEASAAEGENTAAPQVPGAPVRQSTYNQALLNPQNTATSTGIKSRIGAAANEDIKGQADQQELELLRTEALKPSESGFTASALNSAGRTIKGAGQVGSDFLGADKDNAVTQYGQKLLDNNPLWVKKLEDIKDEPFLAFKEASGNSVPSMGAMVGVGALGAGIASLAPLTGPAAPIVAAVGTAVQWLGPAAVAALPSYSGIRDAQILKDPKNEADAKSKAIAAIGASAVGAIEVAFGPQQWAIAALTKEGRAAMARKFASTSVGEAAVKGIALGGVQEGVEEIVQSPIEQVASYEDPTTKKNILETLHGGAMGALGGSLPGGATGAAVQLSQQANIDRLKPIADAPTVDDAIVAANEAVKPKEDALRTVDPTLADIEALTGVKPNETQTTTDNTGQEKAAEVLDIVLPDNTSVKAQWKIVDADQLAASMKEDVNQPRDRTRAASDVQIKSIANAPDYRRLSDSPVMDVGAPVVDQDGRIVAGNGRFAGLSQAYEQGTATEYINQLREDAARKGLSIEGINKPVLVRQLSEPVDTRKLAIASNSGTTLQMSALEQAKLDAERMKGIENLDVNDLGDIALTPRNLTQLRDSLGTYTSTELGSLVDKGGQLSQEGVRRVRNAMLAKAYGASPVLEKLVESTDSGMRNVLGALTKSANHIIKTKGDVKPLMEAVDTYAQLKATGQPVDNFLAQQDAFSEGLSKEAEDILRFIDTNVRSQKKLTDFFKGNFREVDATSEDMFDESTRHPNAKAASKNASWVVKNKATGKILFETFDKAKVDALNTSKYEAVPIYEHLTGLNNVNQLENHLKDNGYDFTVEPASVRDIDALDSTKKARKELAEKQAKFFKKRIVFVKADGPFKINGVMVPNIADTIFVDIRTAKPFDAIMAHELSHWMKQEKPAVYKQMIKSIKQVIKDDATEGYAKKYGIDGATKSEITEEIVGDIMGDNFTQQSFWDKVAEVNPEAFKDIAAAIIKWIKGVIVKAKANGMGSEQWVKDATKAQDIVAQAVAQYTESEAASTEGGVKFANQSGIELPEGYTFIEGKGSFGKGKYAVSNNQGDMVSGLFENKQQAVEDFNRRLGVSAHITQAKILKDARLKRIKDKLLSGQDATNQDIIDLRLKPLARLDYASPIIQQLFGISNRKVREAVGDALYKAQGVTGGQYWEINSKKAINNVAAWVNKTRFSRAYHGSPHDHNKFDSSKIGTGEGAQAYGYGHYFADSRDVAEFYKKTLSDDDNYATTDGSIWSPNTLKNLNARVKVRDALRKDTDLSKPIAQVQEMLDRNESEKMREMLRIDLSNLQDIQEKGGLKNTLGKLYEVELAPEQDEYLLWDKPLSEQSDKVKAALGELPTTKVNPDGMDMGGGSVIRDNRNGKIKPGSSAPWILVSGDSKFDLTQKDVDRMTKDLGTDSTGENVYSRLTSTKGSQRAASEYLHSLGIRGIKYLDGSSRAKGEGAYNYVIFDDKDVSITAKFSRTPKDSKGKPLPKSFFEWFGNSKVVDDQGRPLVVYHGGNSDISTFTHEFTGSGADQFGSGFYFATDSSLASGYADNNKEGANVIAAYLSLQNPLNSTKEQKLTKAQIKKIITGSPTFEDALWNFGDWQYEGKARVTNEAVNSYYDSRSATLLQSLHPMANDFYGDQTEAFAKVVKKVLGYDGVQVDFPETGQKFFIAWDDNQIKSAIGNNGQFSKTNNNILFSRAPKLYSKLEQALESANDKVFSTGPQVKLWLQSNAGKLGIKKDEIYWSGIDNWLDAQGKVSKQQVVEFVRNNGVKVDDVTLGEPQEVKDYKRYQRAVKDAVRAKASMDEIDRLIELRDSAEEKVDVLANAANVSFMKELSTAKHDGFPLTLPGGTDYKELVVTVPTIEPHNADDTTHFGDTGQGKQIGWLRMDTRDGGLFIEELQSQRAQQGRSKGFKGEYKGLLKGYSLVNEGTVGEDDIQSWSIQRPDGSKVSSGALIYGTREQAENYAAVILENSGDLAGGVPPAPFVSDANNKATNAYITLLMKKALTEAVSNDHASVSWTTGDQQADRYDLSKQIGRVTYSEDKTLRAYDVIDDRVQVINQQLNDDKELAEYIGKDAAEKLLAQPARKNGKRELSGLDLKTGGEWAQSMYGNEQGLNLQGKPSLMTQAANDIFKHVGSGKIESINGQPGFYITPEMRSKDLPLFSRAKTVTVDGVERPTENSEGKSINNPVNFWKWFGDSEARQWPTSSRGDRAMAPPLVFYHGTKGDFNKFVVGSPGVNSTVFGPWETKRAGMFFTQDKKFAESFATQGDSAQNANVMPVYLKVENAIDLTSGFTDDAIIDALAEKGINPRLMRNISADQIWGMFDEEDDGSFFVSKLKELGYDGAIIVEPNTANEDSAESWVVFNPNQIKSAIGNNGDYSSTNNDIRFSKEPSKPTPPDETRLRRFQRMNQDSFNRFTVIKEWLAENGQKLSDKADVYGAEERYHSMAANQLEDFREQQRNPLIEKIQKAGYTLGDIEVFLKMQHAQEANAQIRKLGDNPDATAYGIEDQEAADYLAEAPEKLAALANEFRDITEQTKKLRLDAGILNTDITDAWEGAYNHYVPVKGEADSTRGVGKGLKTNFKSKRRLGHSLRDERVIENILMDHERAILEVERNRVGKHLVMMAAEMQRPDILSIDQPEKRKMLKESIAYTVEANGVVQGVFKSREEAKMFKQLYATSMPKVAPSAIVISQTKDQRVIASASPMIAENEINVYINGHTIRVQINDELLARAYTKMGVEQFSDIVGAGRILNGYLSKVYTGYNPEFILTNMIRDFSSGTINLTGEQGFGMATKALTNYPRMFGDLLKYAATNGKSSTKWVDSYRANGGNTGAAYLSDMERLGQEVSTEYASYQGVIANLKQGDTANAARAAGRKVFNATLKWIYNLNQAGENAMRLAAFKAMIDSGRTVNEAAKVAKNITVNFNRKGERQWAPALYLFYNASLQGTAATAHALTKGAHKGQAWALAGSMAAVGYMMAASFGGGSEDDWDEISDYTKERNMLIKSGDGYVKVPVPYGYGFFWNLGGAIAEAQRTGEWGKMPWHLATSAISEFTPFNDVVVGSDEEFRSDQVFTGLLPTAMKIAAQPIYNKQLFSGSELMPESSFDKSQPDREKMFRSTKGTVYDELAGAMQSLPGVLSVDMSPETLKYLTRTFTGGAGSLVDTAISATMLKAEGAELDTQEIPFVRKGYMELGIKDKRAAYYKVREEARTAAEEFNRARRDNDVAKTQDVLKDKKELIALDRYANKLAATIDAARDQQDAVRADKKLSVQEKRVKLKSMEATEAKFYDQYLDVFKFQTHRKQ